MNDAVLYGVVGPIDRDSVADAIGDHRVANRVIASSDDEAQAFRVRIHALVAVESASDISIEARVPYPTAVHRAMLGSFHVDARGEDVQALDLDVRSLRQVECPSASRRLNDQVIWIRTRCLSTSGYGRNPMPGHSAVDSHALNHK